MRALGVDLAWADSTRTPRSWVPRCLATTANAPSTSASRRACSRRRGAQCARPPATCSSNDSRVCGTPHCRSISALTRLRGSCCKRGHRSMTAPASIARTCLTLVWRHGPPRCGFKPARTHARSWAWTTPSLTTAVDRQRLSRQHELRDVQKLAANWVGLDRARLTTLGVVRDFLQRVHACPDTERFFFGCLCPQGRFSTFVLCMGKSRQHHSFWTEITRRLIRGAICPAKLAMSGCCPAAWQTTAENGQDGTRRPDLMRRSGWAEPHLPKMLDARLRSPSLASAVLLRSESPRAPPNMSGQHQRRQRFRRISQVTGSEVNRGEGLELAFLSGFRGACGPICGPRATSIPGSRPSRPGVCHTTHTSAAPGNPGDKCGREPALRVTLKSAP